MRRRQQSPGQPHDAQLGDRQREGRGFAPNLSKEPAHVFDHNVYKFQDWPDVDLRGRKPAASKIDKTVHVEMTADKWPGTNLRRQFWARWTGVIKTGKAGAYRFRVKTHEFNGARLFIDNKPVVCSSDAKVPVSSREREYQLQLTPGDHAIMLEFYHGLVDHLWKSCIFSWQPPGEVAAVIPENVMFHKEPGTAELRPGLKAEFFDIRNDPLPVDPTNGAVILQYGGKQYKDLQSLARRRGRKCTGRWSQSSTRRRLDWRRSGCTARRNPGNLCRCSAIPAPIALILSSVESRFSGRRAVSGRLRTTVGTPRRAASPTGPTRRRAVECSPRPAPTKAASCGLT